MSLLMFRVVVAGRGTDVVWGCRRFHLSVAVVCLLVGEKNLGVYGALSVFVFLDNFSSIVVPIYRCLCLILSFELRFCGAGLHVTVLHFFSTLRGDLVVSSLGGIGGLVVAGFLV